ncbi:hypothetical protein RhiXN_04455 [Rhizoctonia solani]|uniref:Uncharacterized protein n=1 Tax=Rhizoctonia solani TaxID=456999 RepID=A0A8H8SSX0_9AGAM|nr:uncharacterized protein RhiXN_04455 [Rhizoctonia solani]QRW16454.1 hypothetical protein RhiXN_04455 [Rhizoctonia solani]
MSTVTDKKLASTCTVIYVQDDGTVAPIEREVRELAIGLQAVKDEQEYIVIRETRAPEHGGIDQRPCQMVEYWPGSGSSRRVRVPGVLSPVVLRGQTRVI